MYRFRRNLLVKLLSKFLQEIKRQISTTPLYGFVVSEFPPQNFQNIFVNCKKNMQLWANEQTMTSFVKRKLVKAEYT